MRNQRYRLLLSALVAALCALHPLSDAFAQVENPSGVSAQSGEPFSENADVGVRERVAVNDPRTAYQVELILYSIRLGQPPGDIQYFSEDAAFVEGKERIERALKQPLGFVFEKIHLGDICDFISETYNLNVILDRRVIRPAKSADPEGKADPADAEYVTDGIIEYINLMNVPLGQCLEAFLHPLGLTYSVQSNFIWISTREKIASESFGMFYRPSSVFAFRQSGAYVFHDKDTLLLGRPKLNWSGKSKPSDPDITLISRPNMILLEGQKGEIHIGDSTPIEYFEPTGTKGNKTYVLKALEVHAGLRASAIVTQLESVDEVSVQLSLDATLVGDRLPLEGVSMSVGEPKVTHRAHSDVHRVALRRWASLIGSADSTSALLLLFKVSPHEK